VEAVLAEHVAPDTAQRILTELRDRADALGDVLLEGVNPPRTDYGEEWEERRAAAYAETEGTGAVPLERAHVRAYATWSVTEVVRFEDLPVGSRGTRRAIARWSDGIAPSEASNTASGLRRSSAKAATHGQQVAVLVDQNPPPPESRALPDKRR
jgi:hypothetical protein